MRKANMFLLIIFVSSNIITINVLFSKLNEKTHTHTPRTENKVTCSMFYGNMFGKMMILRVITTSAVAVATTTKTVKKNEI